MPPAIKVENLSKSYLVGHNNARAESYTALRDVLARNARNLARKTRDMLTGRQIVQGDEVEEFWALKDINFEIQPGDRVGIIGRNGAGKSTLLKILSRITEPTTGRVTINGRVASLLEVGTGFHPELTGRENIFLNGAILGMGRKEIQRKFDEIVEFAEVEKFLDTPVKRYSSGMYVRLAFAVAAHLEPEILVVDEVLAVGDAQFQEKCLSKMESVSGEGRTILFVSHNIGAIRQLCRTGIYLLGGQVHIIDEVEIVTDSYTAGQTHGDVNDLSIIKSRGGSGSIRFVRVQYLNDSHARKNLFYLGEDIVIDIEYKAGDFSIIADVARVDVAINNVGGDRLIWMTTSGRNIRLGRDGGHLIFKVNKPNLNFGKYTVNLYAEDKSGSVVDWVKDAAPFEIAETKVDGNGVGVYVSHPKTILFVDYEVTT